MSVGNVTHYQPDAAVVIVPGFSDANIDLSRAATFSNFGSIKQVASVQVNLTVKNSPGTFTVTLVNVNDAFLEPDKPSEEIPDLYLSSNEAVVKSFSSEGNNPSFNGANYYEFSTSDEWAAFKHCVLVNNETGERSVVRYRRDRQGNIVERWAYSQTGEVIFVVKNGDSDEETVFNALEDGDVKEYSTSNSNTKKKYTIYKHKNNEFFTRYKDVNEQGAIENADGKVLFQRGKLRISSMDRIVIFMSQRFDARTKEAIVNGKADNYIRVFTGFVNSVQEGYSDGNSTITVSGEDVTKLMRLSVINVNPALNPDGLTSPDTQTDDYITVFADILKGLRPPKIIELLTVGGDITTEGRRRVRGIGTYAIQPVTDSKGNYFDIVIDAKTGEFKKVPRLTDAEGNELPDNRKKLKRSEASMKEILGDLFSANHVHIIDPFKPGLSIEGFRPYEISIHGAWNLYQSDFKVRRDIAYKVAEETNFTFYADRNGDIWFAPPRYDNSHILCAANPNIYVIDNDSIISFGFIEDDSNVFSSVYVSTDPDFGMEGAQELGIYIAAYKDDDILLKYGQRIFMHSNPLINTKTTGSYTEPGSIQKNKDSLSLYAKSLMQKLLASNYQGQVTITGRPEIEPGYPVYVPIRNDIFYVESVDHSFSFGSSYTTTLHLAYGRKPWEFLPEVLTFSSSDKVYQKAPKTKPKTQQQKTNESGVGDVSAHPGTTKWLPPLQNTTAIPDSTKVVIR